MNKSHNKTKQKQSESEQQLQSANQQQGTEMGLMGCNKKAQQQRCIN